MATVVTPRLELSELAERFLVAILERLALERITELHLFEPMRQGGVETGIAVIAYDGAPDDAEGSARHTVFTARYRAVLKGPERGKYECEVVAEADVPLLTVETVVRGVQRRSGDEVPPLRLDAVQVAQALRRPVPVRDAAVPLVEAEASELPATEIARADGFTPAPLADVAGDAGEDAAWPPHT